MKLLTEIPGPGATAFDVGGFIIVFFDMWIQQCLISLLNIFNMGAFYGHM